MKRHDSKREFAQQVAESIDARELAAASDSTPRFVIEDVRRASQGKHTYVDVRVIGVATFKLVSAFYRGDRVVFPACLTKSDGARWHGVEDLDEAFARAVLVALDEYKRRENSSGAA